MKKKLIVVLVLLIVATMLSGCAFELPFKVPFVGKLVKKVDPNAPSVVPGLTNRQMKELSELSKEMARATADYSLATNPDKYKDHLTKNLYRTFKKHGGKLKNVLPPQKIEVGKPLFPKSINGRKVNPVKDGYVTVDVPTTQDGKMVVYELNWFLEEDESKHVGWRLATVMPIATDSWKSAQQEFYNK